MSGLDDLIMAMGRDTFEARAERDALQAQLDDLRASIDKAVEGEG